MNRLVKNLMLAVVAVACACLLAAPVPACAADRVDPSRACSLALTAKAGDVAVEGSEFKLWRVASFDGAGSYVLDQAYEGAGVDVVSLEKASDWDSAAKTLLAWAQEQGLGAEAGAVTNAAGQASFSGLEAGLYLVSGSPVTSGETVYTPTTYLESLPRLIDDEWAYDVTSQCKVERSDVPVTPDAETDDPATPAAETGEASKSRDRIAQTGDDSLSLTQVLPFLIAGGVLIILGIVFWRR